MGLFNDWVKRGRNFRKGEELRFLEDIADERVSLSQSNSNGVYNDNNYPEAASVSSVASNSPQGVNIAPYKNVLVYEPKSLDDVIFLVEEMQKQTPFVINLKPLCCEDGETAQRVLDFLSGAVFALNGSIYDIADNNLYLLTPMGVRISILDKI